MTKKAQKKIKCVVWDLDNTLWEGRLAENDKLTLKQPIVARIKILDERGILQSIASRNNFESAFNKLKEFNLDHFFIYPEINWGPKSSSIKKIAESININLDTFAFVDDDPFEREEVSSQYPEVLCMDVLDVVDVENNSRFNPTFITNDCKNRRQLYQLDIVRKKEEENFEGSKEIFLASLKMELSIKRATEEDLQRAEELTVRTNQLNTTGRTYSYEDLHALMMSEDHELLIVELIDRFGTYGKIGLVLIENKPKHWHICLLLMSCRVISRGVGTILINYMRQKAKEDNCKLTAEFIPTEHNRMMYFTYKLNGFSDTKKNSSLMLNDLSDIPAMPDYVKLTVLKKLFVEKDKLYERA